MEFPGNSHNVLGPKPEKAEIEKKDVEKVVVGEVVQRKTPLGRRFRSIFFRGELKGAAKFVLAGVLLPALKNMIVDASNEGINRMVYGDAPPRRFDQHRPLVSYNRMSDRSPRGGRPGMLPDQPPHRSPKRRDASEIILISREEADLVLERLSDIIDKYDVASVADLHDLVGLPTTYVDNKWGWASLAGSDVRQVREGYLLDLPSVEPI